MKKYLSFWMIGPALLSGCFLAPQYRRPSVTTPSIFKEADGTAASTETWKAAFPQDALARGAWWEIFGDPQLNELEKKVNLSNQNIKEAEAQYQQATAVVSEARAAYFPTVTTSPSATRQFGPLNATGGGTVNVYSLPVSASWEPDFWGQVTFAVRTAKASAQATAAQLEGMRLSMQAELASDYFSIEAIDMQTALFDASIESYRRALDLTKARFQSGVSSRADVAQAQTQLDTTQAQATDLDVTRTQLEHAIAVLIGQPPASFSLPPGRIQGVPPPLPAGLPSQLLERRPDIAASERLIAAANGQIGLARAAYFPNVSLGATGGFESYYPSSWLTWPARFWALGASATETLLDFGRRRAISQQAQDAYDASVAAYRQTVLAAFQEVEDNLAALRILKQEAAEQDVATQSADQSLELEMDGYQAGVNSYLDVVVVQNIALANERTSVQILGRRMVAAVTLIRALGGGWDVSQLPWPNNLNSPPPPPPKKS